MEGIRNEARADKCASECVTRMLSVLENEGGVGMEMVHSGIQAEASWLCAGAAVVCKMPFEVLEGPKVPIGTLGEVLDYTDISVFVRFCSRSMWFQRERFFSFWESRPAMILDRNPSTPGEASSSLKHIGFWSSNADPGLCHYAQKWGMRLPWPAHFVDTSWDAGQRTLVADYLDKAPDVEHWRGFSNCRFNCDSAPGLGNTDKGDGTYVWPEGFSHYIREHGVKPPQEFIDHVLTKIAGAMQVPIRCGGRD